MVAPWHDPRWCRPAPSSPPDERTRYARHLLLPDVGSDGQRRLRAARVLVVGAGGLGSPALLYLAAAGVGTIGVVDDDVVDTTNLQRQVVHGVADVGRPKTESAADAVHAISPDTQVVQHSERLDEATALAVVADYDLVLDGADNFPTRYLVGDACARLGVPHVWGSVSRCIPLSQYAGGEGLGAMWGRAAALDLLHRAGFGRVDAHSTPVHSAVFACRV